MRVEVTSEWSLVQMGVLNAESEWAAFYNPFGVETQHSGLSTHLTHRGLRGLSDCSRTRAGVVVYVPVENRERPVLREELYARRSPQGRVVDAHRYSAVGSVVLQRHQ